MLEGIETALGEVRHLIGELEKVLATSAGEASAQTQEAVADWRRTLKRAQERLEALQRRAGRQFADLGRTATRTVQDSPWRSVAIAAAAGLLVGLVLGRHDSRQ